MSLDDPAPAALTMRDMLMEMRATVSHHLHEDELRWGAIQAELSSINGRIWGLVVTMAVMAVSAVGGLVLEFIGRIH